MKRISCLLFLLCFSTLQAHVQQISINPYRVFSYVKQYLPENPVILECGGYNGEDTMRMASSWPKGTIYTFEPVSSLFDVLTKRTEHFENVHVYPLALADITGKMTFYFSDILNSGAPSGSSSLLPPKEHLDYDNDVTFNGTIEVDAMTLDDWAAQEGVEHIDFMWLDMQGYELNMLKASELVKKTHLIYSEVEFVEAYEGQYLYTDVKEWMEEQGFELIAIDFDEEIALQGREAIEPHGPVPYYGNAIFLNKNW